MNNKSMQEREELHKAIWSIADDLRGAVDGWDFKQYILGIMFYRYISESITKYINEDGLNGKYSIYVSIDGIIYNTGEYVEF